MRAVIVSNIMSLDGCYEGPGGDVMAMNMDGAFDAYNLERARTAGALLFGRASFELLSSFWPAIADAPHDPDDRDLSDVNREFSRVANRLPKTVVSDSYAPPAGNGWRDTTAVIGRAEAAAWLARERGRGTGDLLVFGSRTLWTDLLRRGLVDELHLMVGPAALGGGTPLFGEPAALELLEARRFDGSHNVLLRYAPRR